VANRPTVEVEDLIGYFANTLPIRLGLSGDPTLADVVVRARDAMRGMADHQDVPFQRLVKEVLPDRDAEHNPLFQVMLVFQNMPAQALGGNGLTVAPVEIHNASAKFDLDISMSERDGKVVVVIEYDVDLYDEARIVRLLGHLHQVLLDIAVSPQRPVRDATLLTEAEHDTIAGIWNDTAAPFPDVCLHELFEQWADRSPDAPAVELGGQTWTYRQIEDEANRLAARLRALGVGPNVRVAVAAERSAQLVTGLLAISKAGGAYLPLDPAYPRDRLEFMLDDGDARVLLCQEHLLDRLPEVTVPVVTMGEADGSSPAERVTNAVEPTDLAYVIYTSGSTGRPKAVMADHRGRVSNFTDFNTRFDVGPGDRLLGLSSLSFDMCAYDVFGTLAAGACLVLPVQEKLRDPRDWARLMREHRVTVWHSVPALLGLLVDHLERTPGPALACRVVLLGGDWIPLDLPDRMRACCADARVISLGGATEVSMDSTIYAVDTVDPAWSSIPYGAPMTNQLAYVIDGDGSLLPEGVPGELALGGVGVAWGYHDRPRLTAEKFTPNPHSGDPGDRLYRTGDVARWRSDGTLELIGRIDNQVKIRGYRVELGEIAAACREHPAVAEAVVVARRQGGAHRVVAYLVLAEGHTEDDLTGLTDLLTDRLPEYMIPADRVVLDRLPLTPNGKIDRKALPEPDASGEAETEYVAPSSPTEQALTELWAELLGVPEVSANANFFGLGGDSVSAIQLVSRAGERGLELTARQVFEQQTLDALAAAVDASTPTPAPVADDDTEVTDRPSPMQRRMLAAHRESHFPGLYVIRSAFPLPGEVDEAAFRAAWRLLVQRHETLRLRFTRVDGGDRVEVAERGEPDLTVFDWRDLTEDEQGSRIRQLVADECATLTPDADSLLRLRLIRLDDTCTLFLQLNHYLLLDGWSTAKLTSELLRAYVAEVTGTEPELPPAPAVRPYLSWCAAQDTAATERYWRQRLADLPHPTPVFGPEVRRCGGGYAKVTVSVGRQRMTRLRQVAEAERLTVNSVLLAAWASVLSRHNGGAPEVLFGLTTATRPATVSAVESVAGLLVNVLPLRVRVDGSASWSALARSVQLAQLADAEHPLLTPELLAELPSARYDHVVVFDNYPVDDAIRPTEGAPRVEHPVARLDLDVNQMEVPLRVDVALGSGDDLIFSYDPGVADVDQVTAIADRVLAAVDRVIADPGAPAAG
jgi:amino acid adenylation domain-containing protein